MAPTETIPRDQLELVKTSPSPALIFQGTAYPVSRRLQEMISLMLLHADAIAATVAGSLEVRFDRIHVSRSLSLGSLLTIDPPHRR
jgi:hypothetical protein